MKHTKRSYHFRDRIFFGATDPIRTDDLLITSELLYQLSHSSISFGKPSVIIAEIFRFVK